MREGVSSKTTHDQRLAHLFRIHDDAVLVGGLRVGLVDDFGDFLAHDKRYVKSGGYER